MPQPQPRPERLIPISEAAARLGVSGQTIRNWIKTGDLPAITVGPTTRYRIRESDLARQTRGILR